MTKKQKCMIYRIIASAAALGAILILCALCDLNAYIRGALYLIPYFIIGYDILKKAGKGILNRQIFDENFLMAIATVGAMILGEFVEGVAVMLFYQIGELFQSVAVGKSRKNIASLMDIRPDYANIIVNGRVERVDPDDVEIGAEIVVNPGEKIPIDGVVIEGRTTLNTSALTGESVPRSVTVEDEVISGSINISGVIKVRTTKEFGDSTVSKILDLVENSSMKKSRSENFITKFAKYYTPVVCYGALALAIIPPILALIMGTDPLWKDWIVRALTFLVISCPCALVISIPLSFFSGIGCASKKGVLVKGSNYLEALSESKYIVFDKTGTLTKGVFEVTNIYPENDFTKDSLLYYAAYAESASSHPISLSLKNAYGREVNIQKVTEIEEIPGHGVAAVVDAHKVYAGNSKLMERIGVKINKNNYAGTIVYISVDGEYAGCITISDVIKPSSKTAVEELKKSGIKRIVILTGDAEAAAKGAAGELGVDDVRYELLPADKVREVEKIIEQKKNREKVAFVGDGINDAPVLSRADIGIAMGALGSDAAIEAADVVLMDDDPLKIVHAMNIAKKTLKIVKENIAFALSVKFICLLLGAIGIANMWIAIFADVGVMVIAVLNAARALKIKI